MKVLQVTGNSSFGGDSQLLFEWCRFLLDKGCEVHVLSTDRRSRDQLARLSAIVLLDSIYIPRDVAPVTDLRALCRLVRLIVRERYDLVHTHTSTPGILGRAAACIAGTSMRLHTAHGWPVSEYSGFPTRLAYTFIENLAARVATSVICVSDATHKRGVRFKLAPCLTIWFQGESVATFLPSTLETIYRARADSSSLAEIDTRSRIRGAYLCAPEERELFTRSMV